MELIERVSSAFTSYALAFLGMTSPENVMFTLGAVALVLRIVYDAVKLVRYIKDPDHKG